MLRLKWINQTVPKIRAELACKKNYTQKGEFTKHFMRTNNYTMSNTEWYKHYDEQLGDVTELAAKPVQTSSDAKQVHDQGKNAETLRRIQKAQALALSIESKNNGTEELQLQSSINKNQAICEYFNNYNNQKKYEVIGLVKFAFHQAAMEVMNGKPSENHNNRRHVVDEDDKRLITEFREKMKSSDVKDQAEIMDIGYALKYVNKEEYGTYLLNHLKIGEFFIDGDVEMSSL